MTRAQNGKVRRAMKVLAAKKEKSPEEKAQRKKELQQIRKDVFEGRRARTPGGLCSDDLVLNNKGLYVAVSRQQNTWVQSVVSAYRLAKNEGMDHGVLNTHEGMVWSLAKGFYDAARDGSLGMDWPCGNDAVE